MSKLLTCVMLGVILLVCLAGCTAKPGTTPATPGTTAVPVTNTPTAAPTPIVDPSLAGIWYLTTMTEQNGTALIQTINPPVTANFDGTSNITGFAGCNEYMGQYTLTGEVRSSGKGIRIGPLATTRMYCADTASSETTYLQVLQGATAYVVNVNQQLTIADNSGNVLVYQKTPPNPASVPKGI